MTRSVWRDDLQQCERARYELGIRRVVEVVSAEPGAVSVYQFGDVGAPGVSDLDLVVVTSSPPGRRLERRLRAVTLRQDPYVFLHPVFAMSPDVFSRLLWLHPCDRLQLVWGRSCPLSPLPAEARQPIEIANYHDFTAQVHLGVDSQRRRETASVRTGVGLLTSIKNSLALAAGICGRARPAFCEQVESVRRGIATGAARPAPAEVGSLLDEGYALVRATDLEVFRLLVARQLVTPPQLAVRVELFGHRLRFVHPDFERARAPEGEIELPLSYWLVASGYAGARGHLARFHRQLYARRAPRSALAPSLERALRARVGVAEQLFRWLGDSGFTLLVPLGTAHLTPTPIRWRVTRRLRALLGLLGAGAEADRPASAG